MNGLHNVLIVGFATRKLCEYSPDLHLLGETALQLSEIEAPKHAIQLLADEFGVTDEVRNHDGYSVFDATGRVVKSYGESRGSGPKEMDCPCGMAINKLDVVFIADICNNRISLY